MTRNRWIKTDNQCLFRNYYFKRYNSSTWQRLSFLSSLPLQLYSMTSRFQLGSSTITQSAFGQNLGVIIDDQLTFKEHIAKTARSCRFALHNIWKIRPFLTEHAAQLLSRPWSFLGWTTAMLFWLDFHQTQSNLYKWFRMQRHDWPSTSLKEHMLHLSMSPCTDYQLQFVSRLRHWCLHIEQPQISTHLLPLTITNLHPFQKSEIC